MRLSMGENPKDGQLVVEGPWRENFRQNLRKSILPDVDQAAFAGGPALTGLGSVSKIPFPNRAWRD